MEKINLRNAITRNLTYSEVTVSYEGEGYTYIVYGETTPRKEMKKVLKDTDLETIPSISVEVITEKRAIGIEEFINNSIVINESEEN